MDEIKIKESGAESPFRTLDKIDEALASVYPAPKSYKFSDNRDLSIIQKAVLYHRIMENDYLRTGGKNAINDRAYDKLANEILESRDPVAEFVKKKKPEEQSQLLAELMRADTHSAWFEGLLSRSADKKAQAEAAGKRDTLPDRLKAEQSRVQGETLERIADDRKGTPMEFLAKPENYAAMRRILAVELHRRQVELESEEFRQAISYESPDKQRELMKKRPQFEYEQSASNNLEEHLIRLESAPEVTALIYRMTQFPDMRKLAKAVKNPLQPKAACRHESLKLTEDKLIPDAVNSFLSSGSAPAENSSLFKKLRELINKGSDKEKFPVKPTPEDCEKRIKEYEDALKKLSKSDKADTKAAKRLKKVIDRQIERLHEAAVAPEKEKIKLSFKADTLIDYADTADPTRRPMDAIEAREKLIRGAELEQTTFADGEFVGKSRKVTYDKKTGLVNKGPEKLVTRALDLSAKNGLKPELQLEDLRKIKDVLKQSDPFYTINSETYKGVIRSLNKVIKAQENLDKEANIRQVASLRAMYSELDTNIGKYVKEKGERMKTGDEKGRLRLDVMRTLKSVTGDKYVEKMTNRLFDEQKKLDSQLQIARPCQKIMEKWKKAGTPSTPEQYVEFKKDFKALSDRFDMVERSFDDLSYFKMSIADGLGEYTKQAEEVQRKLEPKEKLNENRLQRMKKLGVESEAVKQSFSSLDPAIPEKKKAVNKEQPEKVISPVKARTA